MGYDWPIFMTLKELEIDWSPNDPNYSGVTAVMLQFEIGNKHFILPSGKAMAAAAVLSGALIK